MPTPNEELAAIVATALAGEGLIPPARTAELERKLAGGAMKEADWRLLLELGATPREEGGDGRSH